MPTFTTNYDFNLPLVNDATDQDLWGGELNDNFTSLDSLLYTATNWTKRVVTSTDSATSGDIKKILLSDATLASYVQTLPPASSGNGFPIAVCKTDATVNTISVTRAGSDTIGGGSSPYILINQNDTVTLVSDGVSNWNYQSKNTTIPAASTSVQGIVQLATNTEVITGTDSLKAVVPSSLKNLFTSASSLVASGYYTLPGGFIVQWGTCPDSTDTPITFPIPFPTSCFVVNATACPPSSGFARVTVPTTTGFNWQPGNGSSPGRYIAIGN